MITLNKYGDNTNRRTAEIYGKSSDTKPIEKLENIPIENGSIFIEIDTGNGFFYDAENKKWLKI